MKKLNIAAVIFVIGFCAISLSCVIFSIRGDGQLISTEKTVSQFEKINIASGAEVRFHASPNYRVVVTIDSNLYDYVDIFTRSRVLNIRTEYGNYSPTRFQVDVYSPALSGVSVSGSGSFAAMDRIITSSFESVVSGSGTIEGTIECNSLTASISGSGAITIAGTGRESNVRISGSGDFNGIEFKTNNVSTRISGSGNMNIWALDYLQANISGSGSVRYRGTPRIDFSGSGSGRLRSE